MTKIDRHQIELDIVSEKWHYIYNDVLDFLEEFTFSLAAMSKKMIHHRKIVFLSDGRFKNMKSTNLVFWEYCGDRINIFNKNKDLTYYIMLKNIIISEENVKFFVHDINNKATMHMFSDGKQEDASFEKKSFFSILDNTILYKNDETGLFAPVMLISDAFDVSGKQTIEINFDIKVESPLDFLPKDTFFVVSQHKSNQATLSDLDFGNHLSINFENLPSNKWRYFSRTFDVSDNFASIGLYLESKGVLAIKNISLSIL